MDASDYFTVQVYEVLRITVFVVPIAKVLYLIPTCSIIRSDCFPIFGLQFEMSTKFTNSSI